MKRNAIVAAAAVSAAVSLILGTAPALADTPPSHQAIVDQRSKEVMPFDLNRTMHVFTPTKDGGVQSVVVHDGDRNQIGLVRSHLQAEAAAFARGDFADPASIHGAAMPGLAELRAGAGHVAVTYAELPNGARITYKTSDPKLIVAIHDWFAAQVHDHGAHAMMEH